MQKEPPFPNHHFGALHVSFRGCTHYIRCIWGWLFRPTLGTLHHLPPSGKVTSYGASSDLTLLMAGASFSDDAAWWEQQNPSLPKSSSHTLWGGVKGTPKGLLRRCLGVQMTSSQEVFGCLGKMVIPRNPEGMMEGWLEGILCPQKKA